MFKVVKKERLYDLVVDEYIEINGGHFEPILGIQVEGNTAMLKLSFDVMFPLNEEDLDKYSFMQLEDYRDDVSSKVTHSCRHCARPVAFDSTTGMEAHLDRCLYNEKNKMCTMCKHLTIYEEAPYPANHKMYSSPDAEWAFGNYRKPYCERYEKYLDEEDLINRHEDCFELGEDKVRIKHTKEYAKWVKLSTEHYDGLEDTKE